MKQFATVLAGILFSIPALASSPAPTPTQAQYEIKFMTDMIDHHTMAIRMAEMCLARAIHDELRSTCQNIIVTQTEERAMMQMWLQDWYGITYTPEMKPGMTNQMDKLSQLNGAEFEIEFMQDMIRHHYRAVIEGAHCMARAYHTELKDMCENIVQTQTSEIQMMRGWLCQWYGLCNWGPKGATR